MIPIFINPLKAQAIQKLVPKKEALEKLTGYSLLQQEGEGKKHHKKASDFYIHQHDELLKSVPENRGAEPLEILCAVMKMLAQRGMREEADISDLRIPEYKMPATAVEGSGFWRFDWLASMFRKRMTLFSFQSRH